MNKTAVIGASGFIGRHLFQSLRRIDPDTIGTFYQKSSSEMHYLDLALPQVSSLKLEEHGVTSVIIASGLANVEQCEKNQDSTYAVNVKGTLELVKQAQAIGVRVVFLSSDYVFDGQTGNYTESSTTNPHTQYGKQKTLVEEGISKITDRYTIIRLSKIYGVKPGDGTFLTEMARSLGDNQNIQAATDQIFCPTYVDDVTTAILKIVEKEGTGTYHVASPESWSRYDMAISLARALGKESKLVVPVKLSQLSGTVQRPLNTSMRCERLANEGLSAFVPLEDSIKRIATSNFRSA